MKICKMCNVEKELKEFYKKLEKTQPICKECSKGKNKKYYLDNKEKIHRYCKEYSNSNKDKISIQKKIYYLEKKEDILEKRKKYRSDNKEKFKEKDKNYQINNREKINEYNSNYIKNKKKSDPLFKISTNIRNLIWISINKMGFSKKSDTQNIIGCDFHEFKLYIESQFLSGMNWENYGKWHLDHKVPVSWATNEEEVYKLNHYLNFKPMWAEDNMKKGNRFSDL